MKRIQAVAAAACLAASVGFASPAQEAAEGRVVFEPAFFAPFNVQTALDMVERVPGFSIEGGETVRGLAGGFGNVLVNGEQVTTKSLSLSNFLDRIPAREVARLELIRGSNPNVDMRGRSEVVNVVLAEGAGLSGNWRGALTLTEDDRLSPSAEASLSYAAAQTTIIAAAFLGQGADPTSDEDRRFDAAGALIERRLDVDRAFFTEFEPSLSLERRFTGGGRLNLTADYDVLDFRFSRFTEAFDGDGSVTGFGSEAGDLDETVFELTGDYTRPLTGALDATLTGLVFLESEDFFEGVDEFDAAGARLVRTEVVETEEALEAVVRGGFIWTPAPAHTFEAALEGAFNRLDGALAVNEDSGAGPVPIELPVSDTRVEERRGDLVLSHVWRGRPGLTVETAAGFETSRISQSGDAQRERDFNFFKPSILVTWERGPRTIWRVTAEREIGQLDFGDFVSSLDVEEDEADIGNPELEPERIWRLEARWERRFGDEGVITLTGLHEEIEAVSGLVPIEGRFDAPGNLGDGRLSRVSLDLSLPLDRFGVAGGLLEADLSATASSVQDPVTGQDRDIEETAPWRVFLEFRQDLPERALSWGFDYNYGGEESVFRLDEIQTFTPRAGNFDIFLETTRFGAFTVRVDVENIFSDAPARRERTFFEPTRAEGVVTGRDSRERIGEREIVLTISNAF